MTKPVVTFRNFAIAPKSDSSDTTVVFKAFTVFLVLSRCRISPVLRISACVISDRNILTLSLVYKPVSAHLCAESLKFATFSFISRHSFHFEKFPLFYYLDGLDSVHKYYASFIIDVNSSLYVILCHIHVCCLYR